MKLNFFSILYKDIKNYFEFRKVIKKEKSNTKSIFNEYNMQHNLLYTKLVFVITLPEECSQIDEQSKEYFIYDKMIPVVRYLDEDLRFNEYLQVNQPDAFVLVDENGDVKPTLSYLIEFNFDFKKLSWGLLLKFFILILMMYYAIKII